MHVFQVSVSDDLGGDRSLLYVTEAKDERDALEKVLKRMPGLRNITGISIKEMPNSMMLV